MQKHKPESYLLIPEDKIRAEHAGLLNADAKNKRKIERLSASIIGHADTTERLRHEIDRLEKSMIDIYLHPQYARGIVEHAIRKRLKQEGLL